MTDTELVLGIFDIISGIAVAAALYFTILQFKRLRKTEQLKLAEAFYNQLQQLSIELGKIEPKNVSLWDLKAFNLLEWNAYLINHKEVTEDSLIDYFQDTFLNAYEAFLKITPEKYRTDKKKFPEFKELVRKLKEKKYFDQTYGADR